MVLYRFNTPLRRPGARGLTGAMAMSEHPVVSRQDWLAARKTLLAKEKAFTHERDALSKQRRELPWVKVTEGYPFEGAQGKVKLADLFAGCSQLIVYHFMLGPDWEEGCPSCSFWADNFDGIPIHLAHRDVSLVAVSRAPYKKIAAYRKRMGWTFPWVSSFGSTFNSDYGVSPSPERAAAGTLEYNYAPMEFSDEMPGVSVFYRDAGGDIFHTYSAYARGLDMLNGAYHYLDLAPKGRDEAKLEWTMAWLRRHDQYEA
jgi:predicted dithiol-disulfide oxidoreductase (DUF899 family)